MTWTSVAKPSVASWSYVNPSGKEQYDQADLTFDSATTYYDGVNPNQWSFVSKPGGSLILAGMATGLIAPPTYTIATRREAWTKVNKPT